MVIKNKNYQSISEVSEILKIKQHIIRYWDSQFNGVSTRLGYGKRRYFNQKNLKKLQTLKKLLHTNGKSHHSLEMAIKIIEGNMIEKKINLTVKDDHKNSNINKLINISENLKKLIK